MNRARRQQLGHSWLFPGLVIQKKKKKIKPSEIELEDPYSPNNYAENFNH